MQIAMNNNATRPLPHGIAHESMAVQPLTLQRDKDRSPFYLARVCHHFTESIALATAQAPSPARQQNFSRSPPHAPTAMPCRSGSAPPAQLPDHRNEFSSRRGSDSPRALSPRSKPNRPVELSATRCGWPPAGLFQPSNLVRFAGYHPQTSSNRSSVLHSRFRQESLEGLRYEDCPKLKPKNHLTVRRSRPSTVSFRDPGLHRSRKPSRLCVESMDEPRR